MDAVAITKGGETIILEQTREEAAQKAFYLTDTADLRRRIGWPLDSLSLRLDGTHFLDEAKEADSPQENPYAARVKAALRERFGQ